jgi:hypothetical protein
MEEHRSWNGLMLATFAEAGRVLGRKLMSVTSHAPGHPWGLHTLSGPTVIQVVST